MDRAGVNLESASGHEENEGLVQRRLVSKQLGRVTERRLESSPAEGQFADGRDARSEPTASLAVDRGDLE